jgi:hypothetical protein
MSEVRTIEQLFSPEAQSVRLVQSLIEFYKSSAPGAQHELELGFSALVSTIQNRLTDEYNRKSLTDILENEGMTPVMDRWEFECELPNKSTAPNGLDTVIQKVISKV